jgi:hypothetical protein
MNITPVFIKSPDFLKLERDIGNEALSYLVKIGLYCQQSRKTTITIEESFDLELVTQCPDGDKLLGALIQRRMLERRDGNEYECSFFVEQNKQLLSNWKNGEMKANKAKSIQSNSNEINSNQSNSTQPYAQAMPKQCLEAEDAPF